jgi:broad specificity phosphatase PhoE
MSRVHMIRHARPASKWEDGGDADPGLDAIGRRQAVAAADRLMATPAGARPVRVLSSPLRRCVETAQPFADRIGVVVEIDPRFSEIPRPSTLSAAERGGWLRQAFAGRWSDIPGDIDYDAWRRGVAEAVAQQAGAAVFSHFVALNAAMSCARGDDRVLAFQPDHASTTVFGVKAGRLILIERGAEAETSVL